MCVLIITYLGFKSPHTNDWISLGAPGSCQRNMDPRRKDPARLQGILPGRPKQIRITISISRQWGLYIVCSSQCNLTPGRALPTCTSLLPWWVIQDWEVACLPWGISTDKCYQVTEKNNQKRNEPEGFFLKIMFSREIRVKSELILYYIYN